MASEHRHNKKHFCVIGAGASGLASIKCCLEHGVEVTCFERTEEIGGLWRYTDEIINNKASVFKSTVTNTSKEFTAFSDFPIPVDYPNFMRHELVLQYFQLYVDKFGLRKHIQFNTDVVKVEFATDYSTTGRWGVTYRNKANRVEKTTVFDGVLVCTGHHAEPHIPNFMGLNTVFTGTVLHTHDYKRGDAFADKNVLVIGVGDSGGDVAVELCRFAKTLHISTRHGTWCFPKSQSNGMPLDASISRFYVAMMSHLPYAASDWVSEHLLIRTDHDFLGIRPKYGPSSMQCMVNDDFPSRVLSGLVKIKPDVKFFGPKSAVFADGSEIKDLDVVILATGYVFSFPFLPPSILSVKDNEVNLYKMIFPPDMEHQTLAVIGCIQATNNGSIISISELQARWAVRVLAGDSNLQSKDVQWTEIKERRQTIAQRYVASQRHTLQVDAVPYMDEIAQEIGCMPSFTEILWSGDLKLALACFLGQVVPFQYRLTGPHAWPGARNAVLTVDDRIRCPLRTQIAKLYGQTPFSPGVANSKSEHEKETNKNK